MENKWYGSVYVICFPRRICCLVRKKLTGKAPKGLKACITSARFRGYPFFLGGLVILRGIRLFVPIADDDNCTGFLVHACILIFRTLSHTVHTCVPYKTWNILRSKNTLCFLYHKQSRSKKIYTVFILRDPTIHNVCCLFIFFWSHHVLLYCITNTYIHHLLQLNSKN
jgi:hypothetical protein